jgi:LPXTG-motif cell wall-anchored protein
MRKILAIVGVAVFGAAFWGASIAGAQVAPTTTTTAASPSVFACSFTLSSTSMGVGGGPVQVSGTAPADTIVPLSVNGVEAATAHSDNVTGAWGPVTVNITATSTVAVSLGASYPATPCIGVGTVTVATPPPPAQALPRTGSNDTKPFVLIGATILLVGVALVLAARRRDRTHGRV